MTNDIDVLTRKHLSEFVPSRIDELGLTKAGVARALGEHDSKIGKVCQGLHTPSVAYCIELAEILECELNDFTPPELRKRSERRRLQAAS